VVVTPDGYWNFYDPAHCRVIPFEFRALMDPRFFFYRFSYDTFLFVPIALFQTVPLFPPVLLDDSFPQIQFSRIVVTISLILPSSFSPRRTPNTRDVKRLFLVRARLINSITHREPQNPIFFSLGFPPLRKLD